MQIRQRGSDRGRQEGKTGKGRQESVWALLLIQVNDIASIGLP